MHAKDLKSLAAVRAASTAGQTVAAVAAVEVGLDCHVISHLNLVDVVANGDDFGAKFVADNTWIGEEGLAAAERVQVGAADADAVNADEGVAGARITGLVSAGAIETARLGQDKSLHGWLIWLGWGLGLRLGWWGEYDDGTRSKGAARPRKGTTSHLPAVCQTIRSSFCPLCGRRVKRFAFSRKEIAVAASTDVSRPNLTQLKLQ